MDKQFWKALQENNCEVPEGHSVESLTPELLSFLGSTDPELRDELAYTILVEWVERDLYTPDDLRQMIVDLSANLGIGIGETETDSVFLRAFFNARNFLRSLYLQVTTEENLPRQEELGMMILDTVQNLRPY
jgi:hypothetical protein